MAARQVHGRPRCDGYAAARVRSVAVPARLLADGTSIDLLVGFYLGMAGDGLTPDQCRLWFISSISKLHVFKPTRSPVHSVGGRQPGPPPAGEWIQPRSDQARWTYQSPSR